MNLKENLPSRPATDAPGFARGRITASPRSGFGRAFAWLLLAFTLPAFLVTARAQSTAALAIPFSEIGAKATADYKGEALGIRSSPGAATLHTGFQKLAATVTDQGLQVDSTAENEGRLKLTAAAVRRGAGQPAILPARGTVASTEKVVSFIRPGVTEEYSVSVDGLRQDFIVTDKPAGTGTLSVELALSGAVAEAASYGAKLTLAGSGRALAYSRLHVADANGQELTATMEVLASSRLAIHVEDAGAAYPVRIDPTFSDADWVSMNPGIPGANGTVVNAAVVDGSGNLYIGGNFTFIGTMAFNRIAKWDGSAWSALSSGINSTVFALAVSGSDLYAGGNFTFAGTKFSPYIAQASLPAAAAPLVTTATSASVLASTATLGGNVTSNGGSPITGRGVVYSLTSANADPLISGSGVTQVTTTGTTGIFTVPVTGLTASSSYSFKAYAINGLGTTYTSVATFTTAAPPNAAPTDITLSNATLAENNATGATIGTLTATDANVGDTHTFTLVAGTGSTDNAAFTITGSTLKINAAADFEAKSSYAIRIRATDSGSGNLGFEKPFTITITDVNEAPVGGADNIARRDNTTQAKVSKAVLLANDTDPEGDPRTITAVYNAQPSGAAVGTVGGFVTYIAPSNNAGDGSFDYTLSDGHGHTVTVTVTVTQMVVPPAAVAPNAASVTMVGSDVVLSYVGVPGNQYRVQYTTSAGPAYVWQEFDPSAVYTAPTSGVFIHTDVNTSGPVRLYRAIPHP